MIDLHTHTKESDGEMKMEEIVDFAMSKDITALAITNHDTLEGLYRAVNHSIDKDILVVPGIELDTKVAHGQMHILGLFIDYNNKELNQKINNIRIGREVRNQRFIEEFNKLGFEITLEELKEVSGGKIIAKPHFARVFLNKNYIKTNDEIYDKYFNQEPFKSIPKTEYEAKDVIKMIKDANGIAILAHPQTLKLDFDELSNLVEELKSYGLDGMECYHSKQTLEQMKEFKKIANKYNLLITKGSDYHGPKNSPGIELGTGYNNNIVSEEEDDLMQDILDYYDEIWRLKK